VSVNVVLHHLRCREQRARTSLIFFFVQERAQGTKQTGNRNSPGAHRRCHRRSTRWPSRAVVCRSRWQSELEAELHPCLNRTPYPNWGSVSSSFVVELTMQANAGQVEVAQAVLEGKRREQGRGEEEPRQKRTGRKIPTALTVFPKSVQTPPQSSQKVPIHLRLPNSTNSQYKQK
jgi:hypothetical protein